MLQVKSFVEMKNKIYATLKHLSKILHRNIAFLDIIIVSERHQDQYLSISTKKIN